MGTASGSQAISLGHLSSATAGQSMALGMQTSAGASNTTALGRKATTATNEYAMAFGRSYASGADSLAAVITDNSSTYGATGANSIAIGQLSKATATKVTQGICIGRLGDTGNKQRNSEPNSLRNWRHKQIP